MGSGSGRSQAGNGGDRWELKQPKKYLHWNANPDLQLDWQQLKAEKAKLAGDNEALRAQLGTSPTSPSRGDEDDEEGEDMIKAT